MTETIRHRVRVLFTTLLSISLLVSGCARSIPLYARPPVHDDLIGMWAAVTTSEGELRGQVIASDPDTLVLVNRKGEFRLSWNEVKLVEERKPWKGSIIPWFAGTTALLIVITLFMQSDKINDLEL